MMEQANRIRTVAIVSLSSGSIGEPQLKFEVDIGLRRLREFGLEVRLMPHAMKGRAYVSAHPEDRASDLIEAFLDPEIDMILCAIGGDDTYRLLPHLFGRDELKNAVRNKIFLGFSDTTINHFMLHNVGLPTFYGQSFLADLCELDSDMLPYTRTYFEELVRTGTVKEVRPSGVWYNERTSYSEDQVGVPRVSHPDRGFELLQGSPVFSGPILGGCIDSMYDVFNGERYADMPVLCAEYGLFPPFGDWKGKIILLESSEEKMSPEKYRKALEYLKEAGVFDAVAGVLVGKPMDGTYDAEYRQCLTEVIANPFLPVVCNLNVGHATPRCILPFGPEATVDVPGQVIRFSDGTPGENAFLSSGGEAT